MANVTATLPGIPVGAPEEVDLWWRSYPDAFFDDSDGLWKVIIEIPDVSGVSTWKTVTIPQSALDAAVAAKVDQTGFWKSLLSSEWAAEQETFGGHVILPTDDGGTWVPVSFFAGELYNAPPVTFDATPSMDPVGQAWTPAKDLSDPLTWSHAGMSWGEEFWTGVAGFVGAFSIAGFAGAAVGQLGLEIGGGALAVQIGVPTVGQIVVSSQLGDDLQGAWTGGATAGAVAYTGFSVAANLGTLPSAGEITEGILEAPFYDTYHAGEQLGGGIADWLSTQQPGTFEFEAMMVAPAGILP
jgi:hypothetical protein